jgi:hypothetical protein
MEPSSLAGWSRKGSDFERSAAIITLEEERAAALGAKATVELEEERAAALGAKATVELTQAATRRAAKIMVEQS